MKKITAVLAAIAFCAVLTPPAFAWGKRSGKKAPKAGHIGNLNVKHAKKYSAPKGVKRSTGWRGPRRKAAHTSRH
jgi:hypothetical protein